jgi:coenzyme Q-binding protein COQ10
MAEDALTRHFTRVYPNFRQGDLFRLAADIKSYPAFVPFCRRTRILARQDDALTVANTFGFGPFSETFVSRARLDPPRGLVIASEDGPWRRFLLNWRFEPVGDGCRLSFDVTFEFATAWRNRVAVFAAADFERRVIGAFERRAHKIFDRPKGRDGGEP